MMPAQERAVIRQVLAAVPELVEVLEPDLGTSDDGLDVSMLLEELARLIAPLLADPWDHEELLRRGFRVVEELVATGDEELHTAVGFGFLDGLGADGLVLADPWLGSGTAGLLEALEEGELDPDSGLGPGDDEEDHT
jgi:hypothetical protein